MQIIGVEGQNPSGHCFVASRIVDSTPMLIKDGAFDSQSPQAKRQVLDASVTVAATKSVKPLTMVMLCNICAPCLQTDHVLSMQLAMWFVRVTYFFDECNIGDCSRPVHHK